MTERHPDIFRPKAAAEYLQLDGVRSLDTLRQLHGLVGHRVGKGLLYHRADLDACALRMLGKDERFVTVKGESRTRLVPVAGDPMKLYAGRKG